MRLTLAFPPLVHPTYVPLGISTLVAVLRQQTPETEVWACDLNILAWQRTAETCCEGKLFHSVARMPANRFFEPGQYNAFQGYWNILTEDLHQRRQEARRYVETGDGSPSLQALLEDLLAPILADRPNVVGFSLMYLDQLYFSLALARSLRERAPEIRILMGGATFSALDAPALMRACPYLDAILIGEGEQALVQLAQGVPWALLPGAVLREPTAVPIRYSLTPIPLYDLPTPAFDVWDLSAYANHKPVLPLVLSRDCRWRRCRFCAHNRSFAGYRERPVETIVEDMAQCIGCYGTHHFYLADQYVPADRLLALSNAILCRGLRVHFHIMARPTVTFTPNILGRAAAAGCCWISWGVETGSQRLLNLIHKGTQRNTVLHVLQDSHAVGITNLALMIFGLPTSTPTDLDDTLDFLDRSQSTVQAYTASRFVLFADTDLAHHAENLGLVITGRERLLQSGDVVVQSTRLEYLVRASDGRLLPPSTDFEIERWRQRRRWFGERPLLEQLNSEHFLLYCAHHQEQPQTHTPKGPHSPPRRVA